MKKRTDQPIALRIAERLKLALHRSRYQEADFAEKLGMPRTTLRTYLDGRLKTLNLEKLEKMCALLDVSLAGLLNQADAARGFIKKDMPEGVFDVVNLTRYKIRIRCDAPLNPHHAHGTILFWPGARYRKKSENAFDMWLYLKSEGGILTLHYNGETTDLLGGERIVINARYPFQLSYIADKRNERRLKEKDENKQRISASFSSSPPFWMY